MRKFFVLFFKVQCFPYFHDKTRSRVGIARLFAEQKFPIRTWLWIWTFWRPQLDLLKCLLITLWIWHPHSPLAPYPSLKRKRRWRNCSKILTSTGIVVAHVVIANTPSKFFRLHLGTNFLSFDSDLLAFSFSNLFLFSLSLPFLQCCF